MVIVIVIVSSSYNDGIYHYCNNDNDNNDNCNNDNCNNDNDNCDNTFCCLTIGDD